MRILAGIGWVICMAALVAGIFGWEATPKFVQTAAFIGALFAFGRQAFSGE